MTRSGEFSWIEKYFAPLTGAEGFGLRDDAAFLDLGSDAKIAITQDTILEGVHFLPQHSPSDVARKALRVNISDLIAKGCKPKWYSLSLGVPDRWSDEDIASFAQGLSLDQKEFGIVLTGGDTYRSPERLCVSITAIGEPVISGRYVSRLTAKVGDSLFVSGTIGDGALGLMVDLQTLATGDPSGRFLNSYRLPPINAAMAELVSRYATASMDVSDGLIGDCGKLCAASNVSVGLERDTVPLSKGALSVVRKNPELWETVLTGGDDYQVLCTIDTEQTAEFQQAAEDAGVMVTCLGNMVEGGSPRVSITHQGVPLSFTNESFSHF